jgi:molybdopterin converting factor small subunit
MRVNVRLFARLRELAGASEFAWEMPDGATVRDVWERLAGEFPAMAGQLAAHKWLNLRPNRPPVMCRRTK